MNIFAKSCLLPTGEIVLPHSTTALLNQFHRDEEFNLPDPDFSRNKNEVTIPA